MKDANIGCLINWKFTCWCISIRRRRYTDGALGCCSAWDVKIL